jgi:RHS repeat-associated protein
MKRGSAHPPIVLELRTFNQLASAARSRLGGSALLSGLSYYGYRWYDPTTGRWPSRDPIEEASGVNLYLHCSNDSLNKFDMFGLLANDLVAIIDTVHSGAMSAHKASETEYLSRIQGENPQVTIPGINSGNPFSPKQPREYGGRVCEICTEKEDGTVTYSYYLTTRLGEWPHTRIGARVWLYGSPRCNPRDVLVGWWHTHPSSLIEVRTGTTQQSIKYKYYWSGGRSFSTEDRGMLTNDMQNPNGLPIFVTYREGSSNHKWKYSTDMFPNGSSVKKTDELQPEWVTYKNGERMPTY